MKRLRLLLVLVALGGLVLASVPAAAHPIKPLRSHADLVLPDPTVPRWEATLTGDVEGTATIDVLTAVFPGSTEHWTEVMVIETHDGETITAESKGVWNFGTLKFRTTGEVVDATGDHEYLIGASVHGMGYTSALDADPITGWMTLRFN